MALSDTLKALSERTQVEADFEARKPQMLERWKKSIDGLYAQIEEWLAPHIASNVIHIQRSEIELNEELFGRYHTAAVTIHAGPYVVPLQPIGRVIIGGLGRVDMFRQGRSSRDERVLIIRSNDEILADWVIRMPANETGRVGVPEPLTNERFEIALDNLLK